jgi:NADPH:quinone reductase-like Zn-dependent oxidoreductase
MSVQATLQQPSMKAIFQRSYGPPDTLEERAVDRPVVGDGEVLVRVHAASVNAADWHLVRGLPYVIRPIGSRMGFGLRAPKSGALGLDVSGQVETVGEGVSRFRPGDKVYGEYPGAFAEYLRAPERALAPMPSNLTFEEAAAMPLAATTALQGLRDHGRVAPGMTVLINGASGGVGHFAVQIAKSLGAEVTGVCSTRNLEMVRSLGADNVVDYTREDFTDGARRYDLILDLVGNRSLSELRRALTPTGTLLISHGAGGRWLGPMATILRAVTTSAFVGQRLRPFESKPTHEDLMAIKDLVEAGEIRPVIDRRYPLSEVAEAIRYVEIGHARGKVVITV